MASITLCNTHKENTTARVSAHVLIYSFLFFKLLLEFGLDFELGLKLRLDLGLVWVRFRVGVRARIAIFLFLRNVTAASALKKTEQPKQAN